MKTSKKLIAGVSAFLLAISSTFVTVSAVTTDEESSDLTISVSSVSENLTPGEEVQITVDLKNVPTGGIAGCEFAVDYDSSVLEFKSIEENTAITGSAASVELEKVSELADTMVNGNAYSCLDYNVLENKIAILWATGLDNADYFINQDGTLVTLTFTVKADITDATANVGIDAIRSDGDVVFAVTDEENSYSAANIVVSDDIALTVGEGGGTVTTEPVPSDTTTSSSEDGSTTSTSVEDGSTTAAPAGTKYGDVNCDDKVNVADLILLRSFILHTAELTEQGEINADVTHDDKKNVADLIKIRSYILHTIDTLD